MRTRTNRKALAAVILATSATSSIAADNLAIEEIVVTAQKRTQSLQDVGIAVTAFSGDQIKEMDLSQPIDRQ